MADIEGKSSAENTQREIKETALTLGQKVETNNDLLKVVQGLEEKIKKSEEEITLTQDELSDNESLLKTDQDELKKTTERIGEIDKKTGENTSLIGQKTTQIEDIGKKIEALKNDPKNLEAVGTSQSVDVQKQIADLQSQQKVLKNDIERLKADNAKLKAEKDPLVLRQKELTDITIPEFQREIERLATLKAQQEANKNNLTVEKNDTQAESDVMVENIQEDIKKIEKMSQKLTQAQELYQRNIALESSEKKGLFEQMNKSFNGVLA